MAVPRRLLGIVAGLTLLATAPVAVTALRGVPGHADAASQPSQATAATPTSATARAPRDPDVTWSVRQGPPTDPPAQAASAVSPAAVQQVPATDITAIITAAALRHGVSPQWMIAIARCESSLDPNAVGFGIHFGLFQFLESTFVANGGIDIWNPYQQADVAARMLADGQAGQWACA